MRTSTWNMNFLPNCVDFLAITAVCLCAVIQISNDWQFDWKARTTAIHLNFRSRRQYRNGQYWILKGVCHCVKACRPLSPVKILVDHLTPSTPFQHIGHFGMGLCSWRSGLTRNGDNSQPLHIMNSWDHRTNGCRPSSWYSHIHKIYVYIVGHHKADDCDTSLVSSQTTKSSVKLWQVGTGCSRWSVW